MKINNSDVKVEFTHDDLVNLLSTATYGNDRLGVYIDDENKSHCARATNASATRTSAQMYCSMVATL